MKDAQITKAVEAGDPTMRQVTKDRQASSEKIHNQSDPEEVEN